MAHGTSKHWSDILEEFTGNREYSAEAITKYFEPLTKWLQDFNNQTGEKVGWDDSCPSAPNTDLNETLEEQPMPIKPRQIDDGLQRKFYKLHKRS